MIRAITTLTPVVMVAALAGTAFGQQTKIENTPHNLNFLGVWGVVIPDQRICLPCHVPHHAYPDDQATVKKVLWNHEETDTDFDMYVTMAGHTGALDGPSKLCLSCHDGVTALDAYGGGGGTVSFNDKPQAARYNLGADLTNDHPIGIAYPTDMAGYYPADQVDEVKLVNIGGTLRVECTSCHDPHNNGLGNFLRTTNEGSNLCLQCHNK